jgi:ketosteroid isomerase-like protein
MTLQENKELVMSWFEMAVVGDFDRWQSLMHEEFRFWIGGNWYDRASFVAMIAQVDTEKMSGPRTLKIGCITAEGDRVLFEAESSYEMPNGNRYTNYFLYSIEICDGKILTFRDFADTHYNYLTFEAPDANGHAKTRESPIDAVTTTFTEVHA